MSKNRIVIIVVISLIIILGICIILKNNNRDSIKTSSDNEQVENEISVDTNKYEIKDIGIIECEKIELKAPIKESTDLEVLQTAVGHFEDTALYNGNVCLAGHNTGTNDNGEDMGFFRRLNELVIGDEIIYHHTFGQYIYKVSEIKEIGETDLSVLEPTSSDKLTLITCIKGQRTLRLCVVCDRV